MSQNNMKLHSALASLLVILFCAVLLCTDATTYVSTLKMDQSIGTSDTLVSAHGNFELRFFPEENSTKYYVGMRYKNIPSEKFVWVANRNYPFPSSSAILTIHKDGNLVIVMDELMYYVSNFSSTSTYAMLLDSGNLVMVSVSNLSVLWQSFDDPTDTILPGITVGDTLSLRSWTTADNPAPGVFSLHVDTVGNFTPTRRLIIKRENEVYWIGDELSNFTFQSDKVGSNNGSWGDGYGSSYFTWGGEYGSRLVLEVSGNLNEQLWSEKTKSWVSLQSTRCGTKGLCGNFGICNPKGENPCDCLYGFRPSNESSWSQRDASAGCVKKTEFICSNTNGAQLNYGFKQLSKVEFPPDVSPFLKTKDASLCERTCSSNCSCVAYAYAYGNASDCFLWIDEVHDLKNVSVDVGNGVDNQRPSFFLKLAASDLRNNDLNTRNETEPSNKQQSNRWEVLMIVIVISFLALLVLGLVVYCYRNRSLGRQGEDLLRFDVGMSMKVENSGLTEADKVSKVNKREVKLPLFSLESVSAATDNFSAENKLGEGGFGPVYKGKLLNGDEVAVKRLSRRSGQGWEELKNEALLIAKLQHNNLVRLLGCCLERDEKMLIYEFMPNKSLDFFLFDETKSRMLDWGTRVMIIDGISQGLLYLHQYSRFRIIHRDLKASNILLDINMNPKISDFGMARIFGGNELQANTNRIVGTYGYMSPEYALEGLFSIKSDVFSFGVLLLEIISGKKNTGLYHTNSLNLLGFAWDLWTSGRGMDLIEPVLKDASIKDVAVLRYVNIALLCVQESPADRPTMSDVVSMIGNENAVLPSPKPHAFLNVRGTKNATSAGSSVETFSVNAVTTSVVEAR